MKHATPSSPKAMNISDLSVKNAPTLQGRQSKPDS